MITGFRKPIGVAITPNNTHAERAVAVKLHAASAMDADTVRLALPRDVNALHAGTRSRLMSEFLAPIPQFAEAGNALEHKTTRLAS